MFKPYLPKSSTAVISLLCVIAFLLASCQVYRPELQQGQQIERENVDQIRQGMEPSEVLEILGTPLVVDPFHRNRWDYVYYLLNEDRQISEEATVTIHFEEGKVTDVIHSLPPDSETDEDAELSETSKEVESAEQNQVAESTGSQPADSPESSEKTEVSEAKEGFRIPGVKWIRNIFKKINKE